MHLVSRVFVVSLPPAPVVLGANNFARPRRNCYFCSQSTYSPMKPQRMAIVVAGGVGSRMCSAEPKQFMLLGGEPVLMRTLRAFAAIEVPPTLVLALHPDYEERWHQLCRQHRFDLPHSVVHGGAERFHTVRQGLALVPNSPQVLVAIHDAVRPLLAPQLIEEGFATAQRTGAAIPVVRPVDSVRLQPRPDAPSSAIDRSQVLLVQTPQVFRADWLHAAYSQPYSPRFTDDASVVESHGYEVATFDGSPINIKLTTPHDWAMAQMMLDNGMV